MQARTTWLSEAEKSSDRRRGGRAARPRRHAFAGSAVLPLLGERGAHVDETPASPACRASSVEWALAQCPRSILMAGLTEVDDVLLGEGEPFHFVPSGCVAKTLDFRTGERRASTLQDLRECTALMDELPQLDIMWTQVSASDVPLEQRELTEYFTMLTETSKHIGSFVDCPGEVDAVLRICEAHSGDLERFRARPRISTVVTAASPLQVDGGALDIHVALAKHGMPIEVYSMTIAGATSPVTLAGTVTQGVAEYPRHRHRPAGRGAGRPRGLLLRVGRARHATHDLRARLLRERADGGHGHRGGSLPRRADAQPRALDRRQARRRAGGLREGDEGRDRLWRYARHGLRLGAHRLAQHHVLPQSVIDNEMAAMLRRLHKPVEVSEATLSADAVAAVGPGGSFLGIKDTAKRIRAGEHYMPTLSNRLSYEKWTEDGISELDDACEQVELRLAAHADKAPYLDGAQLDEIAAICRADDEAIRRARRG